MDPDDEESFGQEFARFILACLQIAGIALAVGIIFLMWVERGSSLPQSMCIASE